MNTQGSEFINNQDWSASRFTSGEDGEKKGLR